PSSRLRSRGRDGDWAPPRAASRAVWACAIIRTANATMKRSTERILTTHCGSLARPHDLLDLMKAKLAGEPCDEAAFARRVRSAGADSVRRQIECGIDVPNDGEQGKPGFFAYVRERLSGFEAVPGAGPGWPEEVAAFPEYYREYFGHAMLGGSITGGV